MTVVARHLASVPRRTSLETWRRVVELISAPASAARTELESVSSVAAMLVAEEYASVAPITVSGGGPLLRIYTLHGADSIDHDLDEETPLSFDPTTGDSWSLSLPALGDDVHTANEALTSAPHVTARDAAAIEASVSASTSQATARPFVPDIEELERP